MPNLLAILVSEAKLIGWLPFCILGWLIQTMHTNQRTEKQVQVAGWVEKAWWSWFHQTWWHQRAEQKEISDIRYQFYVLGEFLSVDQFVKWESVWYVTQSSVKRDTEEWYLVSLLFWWVLQ
jgi:hypothetical protein